MRKQVFFTITNISNFKDALLQWSQQFDEITWLDSNHYKNNYNSFDALLAVDAFTLKSTDYYNAFTILKEYQQETKDWLFGYLSYDLKNNTEQLSSQNYDGLHFPDLYFFQPKKIITIQGTRVSFNYLPTVANEIEIDFKFLFNFAANLTHEKTAKNAIKIKMRIFKNEYYKGVNEVLRHIHRGDIYEANLCQEFYAENITINTLRTYTKLNAISKAPFACYLKYGDKYLLSASPERYLKKEGQKIISQPIKGTTKRSLNKLEDEQLKYALVNDKKEQAENIMIVDLVRNDLSKSALKGSVQVEDLCKLYSFEQVHHLISTVIAKVSKEKNPVEIIKETFPMGSMTGAPKISAMQIIEAQESFRRGLYSGAVGYFTPEGDFDFNVVIRSILYNATEKYVSFSVGSAITAKSVPEKEYEECLLKAKAMRKVLEG